MLQATENVFNKYNEPTKSCLLAMHKIAIDFNSEMSEGMKYGMPLINYKGKMFCYLWVDKKTSYPYYLMVKGDKLKHSQLEKGDRKKMCILTINPNNDIDISIINEVFSEALSLYK